MDQNSGLFTVIAYFFKVFTNLRFDSLLSPIFKGVHECFAFHTGWSILALGEHIQSDSKALR